MAGRGHYDFSARFARDVGDGSIVGRNDDTVSNFHRGDPVPDSRDEGSSSEKSQRFPGKTNRAEPGGNYD
jgi:hypothetical protein